MARGGRSVSTGGVCCAYLRWAPSSVLGLLLAMRIALGPAVWRGTIEAFLGGSTSALPVAGSSVSAALGVNARSSMPQGHANQAALLQPQPAPASLQPQLALLQPQPAPVSVAVLQPLPTPDSVQSKALPALGRPQKPLVKLDINKLAWIHIPKCGSSFSNIIITWACPDIPDKHFVDVPWIDAVWGELKNQLGGDCVKKLELGVGHRKIDDDSNTHGWKLSKGHFVGMFKEPEQRILSAFKYGRHGIGGKTMPLSEYAQRTAGCATKMLTGHNCNDKVALQESHLQKAIQRVDEGFAFAGLTNEWELSVCLFHAMFGGYCHSREFKNNNYALANKKDEFWDSKKGVWNESMLNGFRDYYDGRLYWQVKEVFNGRLAEYGLSWEVCDQFCFNGTVKRREAARFWSNVHSPHGDNLPR